MELISKVKTWITRLLGCFLMYLVFTSDFHLLYSPSVVIGAIVCLFYKHSLDKRNGIVEGIWILTAVLFALLSGLVIFGGKNSLPALAVFIPLAVFYACTFIPPEYIPKFIRVLFK
jgi:hypothetical protein